MKTAAKITNTRPLELHGISRKQARLLLSFEERDRVCYEDIGLAMGWKTPDTGNQVKALEKVGLLDEYDKAGHRRLWGITPEGMRACLALTSMPVMASSSAERQPVPISGPSDLELQRQALTTLKVLPRYAAKFKWFRLAALRYLSSEEAA